MHITIFRLKTSAAIAAVILTNAAALPALAQETERRTAWEASRTVDDDDMVTTGVARGRDRLNSATSTSAIKENDIISIAPRSMGELFRNIPGIRVEASGGEANNDYTVRGLPLVNDGSKYIQLQEDGLPVLEFGDLQGLNPDNFLRVDLNVAQVESIRGGSASTFASNAPGGVINLISKTGEVEGGSVMGTIGVDFESYRTDFDYGSQLGDGWRFHVGGFYREGEGPRATGFNAMRGGQVKFNVTKQFDTGYIRVYAKVLDDRTPTIINTPLLVTGTNADPKFADPVGTDSRRGSLLSLNLPASLRLGASGTPTSRSLANGNRAKAKSLGFDAQFNLGEWTVANRFRYADQSLLNTIVFQSAAAPAAALAAASAGPGGAFTYAAGPRAGQALDANGNRLAVLSFNADFDAPDVSNMTNDLRVSRVWDLGGGNLTTTAGVYRSSQEFVSEAGFTSYFQDAVSNGTAVPLALRTGSGIPLTQNGVLIYGSPGASGNAKNIDLNYQVTAPFASFNFATGKVAIGGSVRWDNVRVRGNVINDSATKRFDMNGDGVISAPENRVAFIPVGVTAPVSYDHDYVSYSLSANYRVSDTFSMFGRYSRGGRAGADKILFTPAIRATTGDLINRSAGHDTVRQAELGLKYRNQGLVLNLTGFYALTDETNSQIVNNAATGQTILVAVSRSYKAYGLEFEGGIRRGPFSLTAHATYTEAEIDGAEVPALVGNTPRHQPKLMFGLRPQYDSDFFSLGANIVGITKSFAQDINQLVMPGYATVGMFAQVRPIQGLEVSLNASNLFNTRGITDILDGALPASGVVMARTIYGRTISASARFFF